MDKDISRMESLQRTVEILMKRVNKLESDAHEQREENLTLAAKLLQESDTDPDSRIQKLRSALGEQLEHNYALAIRNNELMQSLEQQKALNKGLSDVLRVMSLNQAQYSHPEPSATKTPPRSNSVPISTGERPVVYVSTRPQQSNAPTIPMTYNPLTTKAATIPMAHNTYFPVQSQSHVPVQSYVPVQPYGRPSNGDPGNYQPLAQVSMQNVMEQPRGGAYVSADGDFEYYQPKAHGSTVMMPGYMLSGGSYPSPDGDYTPHPSIETGRPNAGDLENVQPKRNVALRAAYQPDVDHYHSHDAEFRSDDGARHSSSASSNDGIQPPPLVDYSP